MIKLWSCYTKNQRSMSFLSLVDSSRVTYLYSMISINLDWTVHRFLSLSANDHEQQYWRDLAHLLGDFNHFTFSLITVDQVPIYLGDLTELLRDFKLSFVERFQSFNCWGISSIWSQLTKHHNTEGIWLYWKAVVLDSNLLILHDFFSF